MLAAGVSIDDMKRFANYVAYACVFDVVTILDEGVSDIDQSASGWTLMERGADDRLTGHVMSGLHESLLTSDPTGAEGAEVFAGFDTPEAG